ncbi:MAG TPA: hypothetical protein VEK76_07440 [Candidatus Binatia bacterium]|nr:hypothetical protein [Candidatus Binatia bacterium]
MHWPRDAATRIAERQEREAIQRYLSDRIATVSPVWVDAVADARRRADVVGRLERQLQSMR